MLDLHYDKYLGDFSIDVRSITRFKNEQLDYTFKESEGFDAFTFSRTLSKITIVSLREYPTIVKNAAITAREISYPRTENTPRVIKTSWVNAAIAPTASISIILPLESIVFLQLGHLNIL